MRGNKMQMQSEVQSDMRGYSRMGADMTFEAGPNPNGTLMEQFLLLALNDETGKMPLGVTSYIPYGLAGTILMELTFLNCLVYDGKRLMLSEKVVVDDMLLRDSLTFLTHKLQKRGRSLNYIVRTFGNHLRRKKVHISYLKRLAEKGFLQEVETRTWFVFPTTVYPSAQTGMEQKLRDRIRNIVLTQPASYIEPRMQAFTAPFATSDELQKAGVQDQMLDRPLERSQQPEVHDRQEVSTSLDERTWFLIGLLKACQLDRYLFNRSEYRQAKRNITKMMKANIYGNAVHDTIQAMQTAVIASVVVATVVANSTSSSSS